MMKKFIALLLALVMVFALVACGPGNKDNGGNNDAANTDTTNTDNSNNEGGNNEDENTASDPGKDEIINGEKVDKPFPHANEDGSINLDRIAHFDIEYDYSQNEKQKFAYCAASTFFLYEASAVACESWCPLFNLEWAGFIANNDGDSNTWMTLFQQALDNGIEMFILDPDNTIFPAVTAKLEQYPDVAWMPMMSASRDGAEGAGIPEGGNMTHPYVGFDSNEVGRVLIDRLWQWLQETYPDADPAEVGCIAFDYSTSPALHARTVAANARWKEIAGASADNYWECDLVAAGMTYDGAKQVFPGEIAKHTEIKYWLIAGIIDDWALAAADTLEEAGLTDTSCCVTFGGTGFIAQWDAGQENAARYALFTAQTLYVEPIMGAVYAFKNGWCTPDEIWPSWVNPEDCGGEGHTYSSLLLPTVWLMPDAYKEYLEWTDSYGNTNIYGYENEVTVERDAYSSFTTDYPDYYTGERA